LQLPTGAPDHGGKAGDEQPHLSFPGGHRQLAGGWPHALPARSDKHGAYTKDHPISPGELAATIFHALGIDPHSQVNTLLERPWQICDKKPVLDLWG
jgi:hypothetical protein